LEVKNQAWVRQEGCCAYRGDGISSTAEANAHHVIAQQSGDSREIADAYIRTVDTGGDRSTCCLQQRLRERFSTANPSVSRRWLMEGNINCHPSHRNFLTLTLQKTHRYGLVPVPIQCLEKLEQ
jgi:hypothetical protein